MSYYRKKKKRKQINKKTAEIIHTIKRVERRFGIQLNRLEVKEISKKIMKGKGKYLGKHSTNRSWWQLPVKGKQIAFLYDKKRQVTITAYPPDWLTRRK